MGQIHVGVYYCGKYPKLARYIKHEHNGELEVPKIKALKPVKTKLLAVLRKRGDFSHNSRVLKEGKEIFIPEWHPNKPVYHYHVPDVIITINKNINK